MDIEIPMIPITREEISFKKDCLAAEKESLNIMRQMNSMNLDPRAQTSSEWEAKADRKLELMAEEISELEQDNRVPDNFYDGVL